MNDKKDMFMWDETDGFPRNCNVSGKTSEKHGRNECIFYPNHKPGKMNKKSTYPIW